MHARIRKQATWTEWVMDELAALLWLGALTLLAFSGVRAAARVLTAPPKRPAAPLAYATVRRGDSLWRIALRCRPGKDPRHFVAAICATNHIHRDHLLQPGQRLFIPNLAPAPAPTETVLAER